MSEPEMFQSEKMEVDQIEEKDDNSVKTSDNEDDSSEDVSDNDEELERQVAILEKKIEEDPYSFTSYYELVKLYKELAQLENLRKIMQAMSEHFPLTQELWLDWLRKEICICTSEEESKKIVELFERSLQDYISVDLWLEYTNFTIRNMGQLGGVEAVRNTFERGLTNVGLHVSKGSLLWEAYREYENVMYGMLQPKGNLELSEKQKQELQAQKERMVTLFRRQMRCPLIDMEKTYQEFTEWLNEEPERKNGVDMKNIESGFKKALLKLSKILPYEEQLLSCEPVNISECYRKYLQYEISEGDPARVQCLYERAIADAYNDASLWLDYVDYLETTLKLEIVLLPVLKRAIRNCPWNSDLWQHYMRALERYNKPFVEVKDVMEKSLTVQFVTPEDLRNLWLCYLDYMRRRVDWNLESHLTELAELRGSFNKACEHLAQCFGLQGDPNCEILQYWARIEAAYCKNLEKFRLLWNDILSQGHDKVAAMWLEYMQWERVYGDKKHLRRLFPRALSSTQDWPESVGNAWLNFERDEGTLESYELCVSKYKSRMKQINEQRQRIAAKEEESKEMTDKWKQDKSKRLNPKDSWKRKHEEEGKWAGVAPKSRIEKQKIKHSDEELSTSKGDVTISPPPGFKKRTYNADDQLELFNKKLKLDKEETEHGVTIAHDSSKDNRTIFVSNLDYSTSEDKLKEIFSSVGPIKDLRLVKDFRGRSKGYCYVEFDSSAEVLAALRKDRQTIDGRPMFVSKCDTDKHTRQPGFKYSRTLEKNKLFVKGLPTSKTKDDLEEIFKVYGTLKDIRIVTYRNGHSKGLAYVEFHDEAAAAHALIRTDGMVLEDKTISVAISKPPDRKNTPNFPQSTSFHVQSLGGGGGTKDLGPRGRSRTQMSLLPRSLQISQKATTSESSSKSDTSASIVSSNGSNSNNSANDEKEGTRKPMSNADFRQMLLGTKK